MYAYLPILTVISALLTACLGVFTVTRNTRHPANLGFALGMMALSILCAGDTVLAVAGTVEVARLGLRISVVGLSLLPPAWFLFAVVFARSGPGGIIVRQSPLLVLLSIISLYFIISSGSPRFITLAADGYAWRLSAGVESIYAFGTIGRYFHIYLILSMVLCLVQLENTFRSSRGSGRWRIKYIVFGVGGILAYFIYHSTQALLFSAMGPETIPLTSTVLIISTAMLAVFIVKHRLLDVDIFISRYFIYNSLTVLAVGLYLIATGLVVEGIRYFDLPLGRFIVTIFVFVSMLGLLIVVFSSTVRRKAKLFINRNFYKHKYEFRDKWMETTDRLSYIRTVNETAGTLTALLSETMGAREVYLWVFDPAERCYRSLDSGVSDDIRRIDAASPLMDMIRSAGGPFLIEETGAEPGCDELQRLAEAAWAVLCAPLLAGREVMGFMLQGPDISGEPYMEDDFELLKAVTTQAAIQIKNIRLSEDILKAKELEAFHRMSSFVMHDLKNLTNSLSLVSHNAKDNMENPEFQKDAIRTIDQTVRRMKTLISKLSSMPGEVELKRKCVKLKTLVHRAIIKLPAAEERKLTILNEVDPLLSVEVDPEAMDMVILNIVSNAADAIEGDGRILVRSVASDGIVELQISDNGKGMTEEFLEGSLFRPFVTTKKKGFGVGLFQCKTIVEAHGGSIEVASSPGEGSTFKIRLPAGGPKRPDGDSL